MLVFLRPLGLRLGGLLTGCGKDGAPGATGPQGPAGTDGATWYSGIAYSNAQGKVGDFFYDTDDFKIYRKTASGWEFLSYIRGEDGDDGDDGCTWLTGSVDPTTEGNVGDFYLNTVTYDIFEKTASGWEKKGNIKGQDGTGVVQDELPSYWKSYLDEKIVEINAKAESYGPSADSFIFITDQHLDGSVDHSAAVINYIAKNTSIRKVVFGGDTLSGSANDRNLLREYVESFDDELLVLGMRGNHDADGDLTENAFYDIIVRPLIDKVEAFDDLYYCYDNNAQKVRYIITDSVASKSNYLTSDEQLNWMKEKILELESDWTTIIFHHGIWEGSQTATALEKTIDGQRLIDAVDSVYDQAKCNIAGIISGHNHRDYYGHSSKGYALISTTTDSANYNLSRYDLAIPTRTEGTTTEQSFDVVFINPKNNKMETIRIGAGENRTFEYDENTPQDVSGVALSKSTATTWVGNNVTITANVLPANAVNKNVSWSISSGSEYGTISANGSSCIFTPTGVGTAVIMAQTEEGDFTATCTITIVEESLQSVNLTSQVTWTPGSITYANGVASSTYSSDWIYSSFIDVGDYDTITFARIQTTNTETPLGYAFYDESKSYISGASNGENGTYDVKKETLTIPSNAKYFRCMWMNTTHGRYNANKAIYHIDNFYCYGNYGNAVPEIIKNVTGVTLDKENIATIINGDDIVLTATILPTGATNQEVTWSIVSGEEFGELSSDGLTCTFTPGSTAGNVVVQVQTADGDFTATCSILIVEPGSSTDITDQFATWTAGAIEWANGNVNTTGTNYTRDWIYSQMVDVEVFATLTFTHVQTTNTSTPLGYAFYTEDGTYISGASNSGTSYDTKTETIVVPENAKYFRCMWMNTTHPRYEDDGNENEEVYSIDNFYCYGNTINSEPVE